MVVGMILISGALLYNGRLQIYLSISEITIVDDDHDCDDPS